MTQSTQVITALRQRMIDDMRMRKFAAKTQSHYLAQLSSSPVFSVPPLTRPRSRICGVTSCTWLIAAPRRFRSMLRSAD